MVRIKIIPLAMPRKKRCPACDRTLSMDHKILLIKREELLGDLELCAECTGVVAELVGKATEKIVAHWQLGGEE